MIDNSITFQPEARNYVLNLLGKAVDEEGYVIEKDSRERVVTPDGDEVQVSEFAGVHKGSMVFVKKDLASVLQMADRLK